MRFWKKRLQRVAAMVCSVALVASMMPTAVFATESQATTPTTEPTSIVETTPEPSESPVNTDATVTTPAPGTGTGSTSALEATPAGNTDDTTDDTKPVESPEPSEEPTDDTTESGEEGTETTDSTTVPGEEGTETTDSTTVPNEENVEQQVSVPQTLAAAPAAAPETRQTSSFDLKSEDGTVDLGVINYTQGGDQTTTFQVYLNYMPICTISDVNIQARSIDYKNFQVVANGDYYLRDVTLVDSTLDAQTVVYYDSTDSLQFSRGYASGKNTVALYFFNYDSGVEVDFNRQVNNGVLHLDEACSELNIHFVVDGFETVTTYTNWSGTIYLPRETQITVTPTINNGYYFEYWHTADAAVGKNNIYTIGADGKPILNYTGPLAGQEGHVAFSESMIVEYGAAFTQGTIGLYMTDGERIDDFYDYKITYSPNGDGVVPETDQIQYFYRSSKGTYGTSIRGCMFKREGYRFKGWNTERDGSGTSYSPDEIYGAIDGEDDLTLYAQWEKIETPPEDDKPDAPDGETLRHLGLGVRVQCITKPDEHGNVVSTIGNTSVKFGDVVEKDGHYECVATISAAKYIEDFNDDPKYGMPGHTGKDTEVQVVLTSDGKDDPWKLAENQSQIEDLEKTMPINITKVVTFEVTCKEETTEIPDVDVTKLGAIIAVDCTTAAEDHPTWMSTILGTFGEDYTIEYSSDKATATITIKNIDDYVSAYGHYVDEIYGAGSYHALDKTKASDLSFKLKYENDAWVLDSDDNTATIYVSCPDVTVEKTITSVERDGKTLPSIPEMLKVGDKINYQIVITNNSNITLNDLTVTDTFTGANAPDAVSGSTKTWDKTADGWTWSDTLTLNVNDKKTFTYTYTVAEGDKGNTIRNSAAVAGKGLDDDEETDDETTPEVENPAVGVEKNLVQVKRGEEIFLAEKGTIPEQLEVGDELTYEIEVKNIGNVKLNGLTLTDTFNGHFAPSKVKDKVDNVELTNEWEKDTTTGPWTLKIENISPDVGEIETYTYTYIVNQADAGNKLTNTAVVTGDDTDPDDDKDEHEVKDDGKITLRPADITIYMGGEDGYGDSNSLPEPGFYITLPDKVKTALQDADYPNGEAADLSDFITGVTATTEDGQTRHWDMEKYGADDSTAWIDDTKQAHFVYRIVPEQGQPAISVNFTDSKNNPVKEDTFTLTDSLSETYFMSLNTASVDVETISLTFNIKGEIFHCGYDAENSQEGTLTVRYASEEHDTTKAVTSENNLNPDTFGVVVGSNQLFNINQEDEGADGVDVTHKDVSLLADNIVSGNANEYVEALTEKAQEEDDFASSSVVQAMYLDLVDAENGNAWLTTKDNAEVTVFWPYPEGINKESDIQLIHFKGLDREMGTTEVVKEIEAADAEPVTIIERLEDGFTFKTSSFSPFVLVQNTTQPSGGEDKPSGGDNGNNDNNNNNTNTNNQTTTVNVANQAAAPAAAPAAVSVPQTSDDMPIGALTAAAVAAAAALVGLLVVRKRRQK